MKATSTRQPSVRSPQAALDPMFSWIGGKRWAAPLIAQMTAKHSGRIVELFGGALGVSLSLMPRKAHINDNSPYLIGLYEAVRAGNFPRPIRVPHTKEKHVAAYARVQRLWKRGVRSGQELGLAFYPVMVGAFNGIYRTNKDGMLGAFGWNRRANPRQVQDWEPYRKVFKRWTFSCRDWSATRVRPGDLVLADPPYHDTWAGYSQSGFPFHEQVRLALAMLDHPGPTILHNHRSMSKTYADLGFRTALVDHKYMQGVTKKSAKKKPAKSKAAKKKAKGKQNETIATKGVPLPTGKGVKVVRPKQSKRLVSAATVRALSKRTRA